MNVDEMITTMNKLGVSMPTGVSFAFACTDVAEHEIEGAYPRRRGKRTDPDGLFLACCPNELFAGKLLAVYTQHVRELIKRSRTDKPNYSLATEAEVLLGIMEASKHAPLGNEGMLLAERLFERVLGRPLPGRPLPDSGGHQERERWPGQFEEVLAEARRKVRTGR